MTTQIATTQEQYARLLKCGVPAETADMCYNSGALSLMDYDSAVHERDSRRETYEVTPAWSLSRLLTLLPYKIPCGDFEFWLDVAHIDYGKQWSMGYYCIEKPRTIKGLTHTESLIECAVQEIEWLSANGYKLKGGSDA